jgi:hypothetical protein
MSGLEEMSELMRRMGEPEASVQYQLTRAEPPRPTLLEQFDAVLRPGPTEHVDIGSSPCAKVES